MQWDVIIRGIRPRTSDSKEKIDENMPADPPLSQTKISKREALDSKTIYSFYYALALVEYKKITSCESVKDI